MEEHFRQNMNIIPEENESFFSEDHGVSVEQITARSKRKLSLNLIQIMEPTMDASISLGRQSDLTVGLDPNLAKSLSQSEHKTQSWTNFYANLSRSNSDPHSGPSCETIKASNEMVEVPPPEKKENKSPKSPLKKDGSHSRLKYTSSPNFLDKFERFELIRGALYPREAVSNSVGSPRRETKNLTPFTRLVLAQTLAKKPPEEVANETRKSVKNLRVSSKTPVSRAQRNSTEGVLASIMKRANQEKKEEIGTSSPTMLQNNFSVVPQKSPFQKKNNRAKDSSSRSIGIQH